MKMEIKHLQYVLAIAKYKNLSYAARNLFITQPALSHQLNAIEKELGEKLLIRSTHSVEITEAGLIFCEHASEVLAAMDRLYDAFDSGESGMRHSISLGLFPFFRYTPVNKLLLSYFGEHRDIIGSLRTVENYHAFNCIANGTLDFAILKCRKDNIPDVDHIVLDREPYCILASADRFPSDKKSISIAEVSQLPFLTGAKGTHYYDDVHSIFNMFNLKFNVVFHNTLEAEWLINMIENDYGVTFMTGAAAETLAKRPSLVVLPIEEGLETTVILAYGKTAALSTRNKQFMDHIIRNYPKYQEG